MKVVRKIKVKNALGLHTRPAAAIVKLLQLQKASVSFTYKDETINARSIMSILMLAAKKKYTINCYCRRGGCGSDNGSIVCCF